MEFVRMSSELTPSNVTHQAFKNKWRSESSGRCWIYHLKLCIQKSLLSKDLVNVKCICLKSLHTGCIVHWSTLQTLWRCRVLQTNLPFCVPSWNKPGGILPHRSECTFWDYSLCKNIKNISVIAAYFHHQPVSDVSPALTLTSASIKCELHVATRRTEACEWKNKMMMASTWWRIRTDSNEICHIVCTFMQIDMWTCW